MCIGSRTPHCRTVFQNRQDKTPKASPDDQSIMGYSPGLPQDTKSLRSCSGDRAKMLLKGQLRIKCHSNISRSSDSFSTVPSMVNGGEWGCIVHDLETIIVLVLLTFNFIPPKVTPRIHSDEVTVHGLCYRNSTAWGWHNSHQGTHQCTLQCMWHTQKRITGAKPFR